MKSTRTGLCILTICMLPNFAYAEEWSFQIEPYVMATTIEGNASVNRMPNTDLNVTFDTILDNLESAAMVHAEAHHSSGWGMVFDYGFMDLGGTTTNDNGGRIKADVRQGVLEGFAVYRTALNNGHLDFIAGARWWDNDVEVSIDAAPTESNFYREVKSDWIDSLIGIRLQQKLSEHFTFQAHADVGGFGLGSSSDFTTSLQAGVLYNISDLMTLDLKYKATWVDFDEGTKGQPGYFQYDTVTHGPVIGLAFNF